MKPTDLKTSFSSDTSRKTNSKIKIVATAAISANGLNKKEIFNACLEKKSAVNDLGLAPISEAHWKILSDNYKTNQKTTDEVSRCLTISHQTLSDALLEVGWSKNELLECGFIFATTTSQIDQWQNSLPFCYMKNLNTEQIIQATKFQSLGLTLTQLQDLFQISGPSTVIASSCSASLQALCIASLWLRTGVVKRCIVGSTEILSDLTVNGFSAMRLLTKGVSKPFDKNRNGINLGEASAFICLEAENTSNKAAHCYISGVGLSSDAFHPTSPEPNGRGSLTSMTNALSDASITANELSWIHAHGTGSQANDLAEAHAIKSLFSNESVAENLMTTSTKSIHGHTLGACGALETVLSSMCLQNNIVLPTFNTTEIDPQISLNIVLEKKSKKLNHILKNSLGFGGINASIILSSTNLNNTEKSFDKGIL